MATATPFRIHDENDYSLMASQSRTAKKGLGGGKAPLASATPLVQKTGSKAVLTQKSQRKALSSLSTSNLNARGNLQTPANEGKKAAVKVVQIAEAANEVHLAAEDEHDPLDMVCSGATKWTPMDPYDQVLARVAAREAGAPCTLYCDFPPLDELDELRFPPRVEEEEVISWDRPGDADLFKNNTYNGEYDHLCDF